MSTAEKLSRGTPAASRAGRLRRRFPQHGHQSHARAGPRMLLRKGTLSPIPFFFVFQIIRNIN
jgi:hypothetical protein